MEEKFCECVCENMPELPCDPFQTELITYKYAEGFCNGTLFPELDKKFYGGKCCG